MRTGTISIIGKPNAGKSTLINALVGEKVSIVSWRPQTTRNKIIGILNGEKNGEKYQMIFSDTPGINHSKGKLFEYMSESIQSATKDGNCILYVIDGQKKIADDDFENIELYKKEASKLIVVLNKMDVADQELFVSNLAMLNPIDNISVVPTSAEKHTNLEPLLDEIFQALPEGEEYYPEDLYTDRPIRFIVAEIIREKALKFLQEEIPHGIGIEITAFEERDDGLIRVNADIITERDNHKAIIIGKGGETLKRIATAARIEIEKLLDQRVFLKLWVKVKSGWREDSAMLNLLGYNKKDLK